MTRTLCFGYFTTPIFYWFYKKKPCRFTASSIWHSWFMSCAPALLFFTHQTFVSEIFLRDPDASWNVNIYPECCFSNPAECGPLKGLGPGLFSCSLGMFLQQDSFCAAGRPSVFSLLLLCPSACLNRTESTARLGSKAQRRWNVDPCCNSV